MGNVARAANTGKSRVRYGKRCGKAFDAMHAVGPAIPKRRSIVTGRIDFLPIICAGFLICEKRDRGSGRVFRFVKIRLAKK